MSRELSADAYVFQVDLRGPQTRELYARSLRALGRHRDAAEQFLEAARIIADDPHNDLGNTVARVRCLRSAAWVQFRMDGDGKRSGVTTMRSVLASLDSLSPGDSAAQELTGEHRPIITLRGPARADSAPACYGRHAEVDRMLRL